MHDWENPAKKLRNVRDRTWFAWRKQYHNKCLCYSSLLHAYTFRTIHFHSIRYATVSMLLIECAHMKVENIFGFVLPPNSMVFPHRFPSLCFYCVSLPPPPSPSPSSFIVSIIVKQLSLKLEFTAKQRVLRASWKIVCSVLCERRTVRTKLMIRQSK